jgi:tetratricopeptide (TPR) repeat protein
LPRHRTLRAVVEWSWDLLTPAERLLAERFSVFPAGATPEAIAKVCGDRHDTDELLSSLVDKSLLQKVDGGARLRMLETIREYGGEKLAERGEISEVRRRHAAYYSGLMNEAAPRLLTRDQLTWLRTIQPERDNILAALRYWCDTQDSAQAIALAVSVASMAFLLGDHADIADLIGQAVAVPGDSDPDLRTIVDALHAIAVAVQSHHAGPPDGFPGLADRVEALGFGTYPLAGLLRPAYAMFTRNNERAYKYIEEALASQDEWLVAATWMISAALAENDGDMDKLRFASAQALERFRALGERWGLASALRMTGSVRVLDGDLDGAADAYAEAGRVLNEMGSHDDESYVPLQLADIAARRGEIGTAREFFQAALESAESDGQAIDVAVVSSSYAMFEAAEGNVELARPLNAAAEREVAPLKPTHPARHPLAAVVAASGLMIALADGDLPLAREHAVASYREAVAAEDMPLLATVGGALAHLASTLGRPGRAAEMLGACAAVRGEEDPTNPALTRLGSRLREALGSSEYARAYAAGKARSRAGARALLDPATL